MKKKLSAGILGVALVAGLFAQSATPIFAGGKPGDPDAKCNSGRGNLSETDPSNDCDPGNSGGRNNGGD